MWKAIAGSLNPPLGQAGLKLAAEVWPEEDWSAEATNEPRQQNPAGYMVPEVDSHVILSNYSGFGRCSCSE
jgi:hypothetical protein